MSKAIEAAARALAQIDGHDPDEQWEEWTRQVDMEGGLISYPRIRWREYETEAQAAITAYLAAMEAEGWVLAPVEPTEAMIIAGTDTPGADAERGECFDIYRAMIAAATPHDDGGE